MELTGDDLELIAATLLIAVDKGIVPEEEQKHVEEISNKLFNLLDEVEDS